MSTFVLQGSATALTFGIVAVAVLAGCSGGDPSPTSGHQPQDTAVVDEPETAERQAEQQDAERPALDHVQADPSASDDPQADTADESSAGEAPKDPDHPRPPALTLDRGTSWRDVYDTLTDRERSCIRDRLGDEMEAVLGRQILDDGPAETWHVDLFTCFTPETGRELLLGTALVGMADEGMELGEQATTCLREVVADVDPPAVIAAAQVDGPELNEFMADFWRCLPELLVDAIAAELGLDVDAASEPELACLREWSRELDVVALLDALEQGDQATLIQLSLGVFRCSPSLLLASFGDAGLVLDDEAEDCVRRLLDESQASDLVAEGSLGYERFYAELLVCVPALSAVTGATSAASTGSAAPDDHGDFIEDATAIDVGVESSGELGSDGDFDFFVFEAEQGVLYEISVGLVTLGDSALALYDAEWRQLAFNDDHAGTLASRLYWLAGYTGAHYIEVWGFGLGAYILLVEAR